MLLFTLFYRINKINVGEKLIFVPLLCFVSYNTGLSICTLSIVYIYIRICMCL